MERFANFAESTLAVAYTAASGEVQVTDDTKFPAGEVFHVVLANGPGGAPKTVFRVDVVPGSGAPFFGVAVEGDDDADAGTPIALVLTAQTMDAIKADQVRRASFFSWGQFGVFPAKEGVLHLSTDGPFVGRNKAVDATPPDLYYGLFPAGLINLGNFFDLNAGTLSSSGAGGIGILRAGIESPSEGVHGKYLAVPSGDFTRRVGLILEPTYIAGATPIRAGLFLRESATGKIITVGCKLDGTDGVRQGEVIYWDNETTINAVQVTSKRVHYLPAPLWYQAVRAGGNIVLSSSRDRFFFDQHYSDALAAFFTTEPDQAGFFLENETLTEEVAATFVSWEAVG